MATSSGSTNERAERRLTNPTARSSANATPHLGVDSPLASTVGSEDRYFPRPLAGFPIPRAASPKIPNTHRRLKMKHPDRRQFLSDITRGMLIAGLGPSLANQLGVSSAFAETGVDALDFGKWEPLVHLLQETPPDKLQPLVVAKWQAGEVGLREWIAAASLANAETFGGEDYVGYHTEMALTPALHMAERLPENRCALPILKVLYRNAARIREVGGAQKKTLHPVDPLPPAGGGHDGEQLRRLMRAAEMEESERLFASMTERSLEEAYNNLQFLVQDDINVHRFVLAHRVWELADIVGKPYAHSILRQSVRFCVHDEKNRLADKRPEPPIRALVPKLLDEHGLLDRKPGTRRPEDDWIDDLSRTIYNEGKEKAAEAVAIALAEGFDPEAIGEAISLAANQLVLRQADGRTHGASKGVHGTDAMNAWRNMIRVTNDRNRVVGLLVGAYHTAEYCDDKAFKGDPFPHAAHLAKIKADQPEGLLAAAEGAIRENDQASAAAAIDLYAAKGYDADPVFDLILKYAVSEDGRLHAEKYFQTVTEEFATTRPAYRWRHLVAAARVTASAYGLDMQDQPGHRAPGYEEACRLLNV